MVKKFLLCGLLIGLFSGKISAEANKSECEKTALEQKDYPNVNILKSVCIESAKKSEAECKKRLDADQAGDDSTSKDRSIFRKFKRACKKDAENILDKAQAEIDKETAQEAIEYNPFGTYEGPSLKGDGLKAGARIAKAKIDNTISKEESVKKLAIGWVNYALGFVAILAVIAIVYAGILYITAMGDDGNQEKAKNIIMYVVVGIILIFGSYAIVNALIQAGSQ